MSASPLVDTAAPPPALLPKIQVSHFGQDISFAADTTLGYATGEEKFAAWAQDYVNFVTHSGASVCYINIGDYSADTKNYYAYLDPAKGTNGVPWIVTDLLDKLPAGVEVGAIAYLDVANPWTIYDQHNFAGNNLTTDGSANSPPKNNMYQSFQMVNAINAVQLQKGGTKFITHYQADGEGAGAFETDTYYGFGGAPAAAGDLYDPTTPNQTQPDNSWTWSASQNNGWPVAGYGYTKWLWNHFMPGTTAPAPGGTALPAVGSMPSLAFTDQQATSPATWSSAQAPGYQFGIIKYAQTAWLQYSPGPMVAYTENYWFGENHYLPGPGSAIRPDTMINIDGVNTPILDAPNTVARFTAGQPPAITFNTPTVDGKPTSAPIGTAAQGYAVMGTGAIDTDAVGTGSHAFFGAGLGEGYSTGAWVTSGGSGYTQGNKYNLNVTFSAPPNVPGARQATGFIGAVDQTTGAVQGIVVIDPGAGYVTEPQITFNGPGSGARAQALVLPQDGYPTVTFPTPPAGPGARQATGYLTVNSQSNKPGSITGFVILDPGAGYDYASVANNNSANPLAGPNGLQLMISSPVSGAPFQSQILAAAGAEAASPCPPIYVPVNSSPSQIDHIVLTVLGDHYDTKLNNPSYTIAGDTPGVRYPLKIDPNYNAAYAPVFNKAGSFPIDGTGLSSVTVLARGSGYSAGASITDQGGGYDTQTLYPVTFDPPPAGANSRTATGFLDVNANGYAIGITITDPGEGYTQEPNITIPGPGANIHNGRQAHATAHLLNYPKVTMTGGTFVPGGGTAAAPYVITGPADKNHPGDPDTSYVVTGIGFTNPGVGYDSTKPPPTFTISAPASGTTALVQALPGLATKYSAYSLQTLPEINNGPASPDFKGPIQGGGNAYNWQISNGYGPGQVTSVTVSAGGSGYSAANPPHVHFTDPQRGGLKAQGTAVVDDTGAVTGITMTRMDPGYGYLTAPTVTIDPPQSGTQATATATIGEIQILSAAAQNTVYDYYANFPQQLALMFDDQNYQDVSLPKLREDFYHPLNYADWVTPQAGDQASIDKWTNVIDGTKVGQSAIATFSIESLNRSNGGKATCLDAKYQDPASLAQPNTYGGTFAGLSSLTWENFVGFLNYAAQRIASQSVRQGTPMRASDVTFQVYDVAFLPLEWLHGQSANRWSDVNETPVLLPGSGGSVAENAAPNTVIYTAEATDIGVTWADRTVTFSLEHGVGDAALLTIDPRSGEVRLLQSADYETKRSYSFTVVATDGGSPALAASRAVTVTVLDLAEPPTALRLNAPATLTVPEDTRTPLVFAQPPFSGTPNTGRTRFTATLSVADGAVRAASGAGVVVGGTPTARTFTGTLAALNSYFTAPSGRISYAPAPNNAADRTLAIRLQTAGPAGTVLDRAATQLDIVPANDAPLVRAPRGFTVVEDVASPLVWPAASRIVRDHDSPRVTVTLGVPSGTLRALPSVAVTVGGTATALTVSGAPNALAAYFRQIGNVTYTTALDDTSRQILTITAADEDHTTAVATAIRVQAVHDRPLVAAPLMFHGPFNGASALLFTGTPFSDPDAAGTPNRQYTVTLRVQDGQIQAAAGAGVVVGGRGTARTFRGTLADLNAFFTASPGLVTYTPVSGTTTPRTLSIRIAKSLSGQVLTGDAESLITFGPV